MVCLFHEKNNEHGFTIIELAIFLLITGTILGVAAMAWSVLVEGRQIQAAKNTLKEANNCLMDFTLMAKKIPTGQYFANFCQKTDPWGLELRYLSANQGQKLNCSSALTGTLSITVAPGDTRNSIAWVIISAGPNKQFDYSASSTYIDLSPGDDVHIMSSDMELHHEICP